MKVILTEKFSVARSLAEEFSKKFKRPLKRADEGFYIEIFNDSFINGTLCIIFAQGHLFEIDDTSILPEKWSFDTLPLLVEQFKYKLKNSDARGRFELIKSVLKKADELYICTDPGREGELIARLILNQARWSKWDKTYRVWTSKALTSDVVYEEMKRKIPAVYFDSIYWSALARQHADFLVGINFTRAATLVLKNALHSSYSHSCTKNQKWNEKSKYNEKPSVLVWSIGRVQTPVLRLIVERDIEIENFKKQKFYVIKAHFFDIVNSFNYVSYLRKNDIIKSEDKESTKKNREGENSPGFTEKEADSIVNELKEEFLGVITDFSRYKEKENPPELFSLTTLQKAANIKFGFSAEKTHYIAQRLYQEYKAVSYPRTEATGLPENIIPFIKGILKNLGYPDIAQKVSISNYPRIFDPKKLTDHHAIIPLVITLPPEATADERNLFDIIVKRFVAAFADPAEYEVVKIETKLGNYPFKTKLKRLVSPGWREVYVEQVDSQNSKNKNFEEDLNENIPDLKKGSLVENRGIQKEEKETKPPQRYTDGTLISEMKKKNLGTPATRDGIIETLLKRGYIVRDGRFIVSTTKGRFLIDKMKCNIVSSPDLTSQWEKELEAITKTDNGEYAYEKYMSKIKSFVADGIIFFANLKTKN